MFGLVSVEKQLSTKEVTRKEPRAWSIYVPGLSQNIFRLPLMVSSKGIYIHRWGSQNLACSKNLSVPCLLRDLGGHIKPHGGFVLWVKGAVEGFKARNDIVGFALPSLMFSQSS